MRTTGSLILLLIAAACGGDVTGTHDHGSPVESVTVQRSGDSVVATGDTLRLTAVARDSNGAALNATLTWSATPLGGIPGAATVAGGLVTGVTRGFVTISACAGGVCGQQVLFVRARVAAVAFTADSLHLIVGAQGTVLRRAIDSAGHYLYDGTGVVTSSSDPSVITVSAIGYVHVIAPGTAYIVGTADGKFDSIFVRVAFASYAALTSGNGFQCGLTADSVAFCWGANRHLQVGDTTPSQRVGSAGQYSYYGDALWPQYARTDRHVVSVGSGDQHSCALTAEGRAWCWGDNDYGQLGAAGGSCLDILTNYACSIPVKVEGGHVFAQIDVGANHTCGITYAGVAYCWGENFFGELGNGGAGSQHRRPQAVGGGLAFIHVSAGNGRTCGVTTAESVYCWGFDYVTDTAIATPTLVPSAETFSTVATGDKVSCAIASSTALVYCWGKGAFLGRASASDTNVPTQIASDSTFESVSVEFDEVCGLTTGGTAMCWPTPSGGAVPTAVTGVPPFVTLTSGGSSFVPRMCGTTAAHVGYCWDVSLAAGMEPGQP